MYLFVIFRCNIYFVMFTFIVCHVYSLSYVCIYCYIVPLYYVYYVISESFLFCHICFLSFCHQQSAAGGNPAYTVIGIYLPAATTAANRAGMQPPRKHAELAGLVRGPCALRGTR